MFPKKEKPVFEPSFQSLLDGGRVWPEPEVTMCIKNYSSAFAYATVEAIKQYPIAVRIVRVYG